MLSPQIAPVSALIDVAVLHERCGFFRRPSPQFSPISGSAPTALHHAMNSSVPNWFDSRVFQALSSVRGRSFFGPTPSSQL